MHTESGKDKSERLADDALPERPIVKHEIKRVGAKTAETEGANNTIQSCTPSHGMEWLKIIINVLLGVIALCIYNCQLTEMRNANTFAGNTANSASDSVKQAREASHLEQRGWVSTIQAPNSDLPNIGVKWAIRIPIKNTGKTFARNVGADCQLQLVKAGNKIDFKLAEDPGSGPPLTNLLLSPDGQYTFTYLTSDPLDDKRLELIKSRDKGQAVLFGYITYYDIFDCAHWTIFCFKFDSEHSVWEISSEHNDADNDRCNETPTK
jgi:hypothetical protein